MFISGYRKKDEACEPLQLAESGWNSCFNFLNTAADVLISWKSSGLAGLTKETFTACIQSIKAMVSLAEYLIFQHDFLYVLPGKFCSDAIEGRFGWYRQVNGGNFFMSINQLFQAEKKIRCLSLIEKNSIFSTSNLALSEHTPLNEKDNDTSDDGSCLYEYLGSINIDEISESDASILYFVSGYIARSVSRRRKCSSCKELLIMKDEDPSVDEHLKNNPSELLVMANRGGLCIPTEYCFALCSFASQLYAAISAEEEIRKKLLSTSNQRVAFVSAATKLAKESDTYNVLCVQTCLENHNNFDLILRICFNCFAKNELKRLNRVEIEAPAKMSRTIRKLTSKSAK